MSVSVSVCVYNMIKMNRNTDNNYQHKVVVPCAYDHHLAEVKQKLCYFEVKHVNNSDAKSSARRIAQVHTILNTMINHLL